MDQHICPSCDGAGWSNVLANTVSGCRMMEMPCFRCNGSGSIPLEMIDWIEAGKKLKAARMVQDLTLREFAKKNGIDLLAYSKAENGLSDPSNLIDPKNTQGE